MRLIVGMSGASGAPLTVEVLRLLREAGVRTGLIVTDAAYRTLQAETDLSPEQLRAMADECFDNADIGAGPASGSWQHDGMIVVPASMKTVAGIVSGYSDSLLLRAADVTLKERRPLAVVPRDCPFGTLHLRNLYELSQLGAIVVPPVMSYYQRPQSAWDCTHHIACKILDLWRIDAESYRRWQGT